MISEFEEVCAVEFLLLLWLNFGRIICAFLLWMCVCAVLSCFYIYSYNETRTVYNRRGGRGGYVYYSFNSVSEDTTGATGGEIYEDGGRNGGGGDDDGLGDRGDDDDGDNFLEDELGEADDDSWGNEDYENNRVLLVDRMYMKFKWWLDCYFE